MVACVRGQGCDDVPLSQPLSKRYDSDGVHVTTKRHTIPKRLWMRCSLFFRVGVLPLLVVLGTLFYHGPTPHSVHALVVSPLHGPTHSLGSRIMAVQGGKAPAERLQLSAPNQEFVAPPLERPVLAFITPDGCSASSSSISDLIRSVEEAVAGGVSLVQLRDYKSNDESKAALARQLRAVTTGKAWFVVNGDCAMGRACGADGVHLPERMIGLQTGLRDAAWPRVVGCSVHSVEAAVKAGRLGADYVQVGTMFATQSHPGKEPEGVALLTQVRRVLKAEGLGGVLVIGVGGIDASNCGSVAAAGADGVAAIRCLCEGADAQGEAHRMVVALREHLTARGVCE